MGAGRGDGDVNLHYTDDASTDAAGRFVVERVPPVTLYVQPMFKHGGSTRNLLWSSGRTSIAAGQTTRITLPRPGRAVVGRVSLPWDSGLSLADVVIEMSVSLRAPSISSFGRRETEKPREAHQAFLDSEVERAFRRDKIAANAAGAFCIEGLPETWYVLEITAYRKPASPGADRGPVIARKARRVQVPPLTDYKEPVGLGNLVLETVTPRTSKPPAAPPPKPAKTDAPTKADAPLRLQAEESAAADLAGRNRME